MAERSEEQIRLFAAVWLDPAAQASIAPMERWVKSLGSYRLIPAEQRHLTVAFLGDVGLSEAEQLAPSIGAACEADTPFAANLTGVVALPSARKARVLGAGLDGDNGLADLITRVRQAASEVAPTDALLKELDRDPLPHITIARAVRRSGGAVDLDRAPSLTGRLNVSSVDLVRSVLTSAGPVYKTLASVSLSGGG